MKGKKLTHKELQAKLAESAKERRRIFKELCDHLGKGLSMECFPALSDTSIKSYLKLYPEEFCEEELKNAFRKGRDWWEGIGRRQASGDCLGNSRTWYYNMANRYGWREKLDIEAEHKGSISINVVSYASKKGSTDTSEQ